MYIYIMTTHGTPKTIAINGIDRDYITVNVTGGTPNEVLLCFPGESETANQFLDYTGFYLLGIHKIV